MIKRLFALLVCLLTMACSGERAHRSAPPKTSAETSPAPAQSGPAGDGPFRDAAEETGLNFRHDPGLTGKYYLPEIMGSGVAVFDYDNDGDLDVFFVQGGSFTGKTTAGCRLFRNELRQTGKLRFSDVSAKAGIHNSAYGMGVAAGDYNGDGYVDLYITNFGSNALYRNNGDGTFRNVTAEAGVDDPRWSTSAAFFDFDRDGWLDLYVANYVNFTPAINQPCFSSVHEPDYCSPKAYRPVSDRLFRNLGNGRFADVTEKMGILAATGSGLGVVTGDVNGDGFLDVYVANDGEANQLWMNRNGQRFEDNGLISASAVNANGQPEAGMGVSIADFDDDGDEDIIVTNLARETATLYTNDGTGLFEDTTDRHGLGQPTFHSTGFGTHWFDFDNDGRLDLFMANGGVTIVENRRSKSTYPYEQRNQLFHNRPAAGQVQFAELRSAAMDLMAVGRGAAFGDLDGDGDVDIVVSNNNGPARLLLNEQHSGNHWLTIGLRSKSGNRYGLGARVAVCRKGEKPRWRRVQTDGSYLTASAPEVHFGLGKDARAVDVEVEWLGGRKDVWKGLAADRLHILEQRR